MAFATKYKTSIQNWDGNTITAEIQFDGSTATVEEFTAVGGQAIVIEHQGNTNKKETYIIPSKASIAFYVNDEWDCHDLLYVNDREAKLIIKNGSVELFVGWVIAAINTEAYTTGQYVIKVEAVDGLSDLKNIKYLNSGALYDAFRSPLTIIQDCLSATGLSLSLWENIDIYADSGMLTTISSSPLNQSYINTKSYGHTLDEVMNCYEVLEKILQAFHCRLFQTSEVDGANTVGWIISRLNSIGSTSTYRKFTSAGSYSTTQSYAPLKTLASAPTEPHHVGGPARIGIKQGYKEVNLTGKRGADYPIMNGGNFDDFDFPTASSLDDWGAPNITELTGTGAWNASSITKETYDNETVLAIDRYTPDHTSTFTGTASTNNGSSKVRINDTGTLITTSDYIIIGDGDYRGIYKVTATGTNYFDINATYLSDQNVRWKTINNLEGLEYNGTSDIIDNAHLDDSATQSLKVELEYYLTSRILSTSWDNIVAVVMAYKSSTDYKLMNNEGEWVDYNANEFQPIILYHNDEQPGKHSVTVEASLSGSVNNYYTTGTPKIHVGVFCNSHLSNTLKWNKVRLSVTNGVEEKTNTTTIDTNFIESLELTFHHTDGDSGDNDRLRHINAIYDDATPKVLINTWDQNLSTVINADNLEDIIQANLVTAYGANSQVWSGTIKGDVNISNAVKDPLNLDRIFQIQRISKNLENNFNNVSMIEIAPKRGYYVELMESGAADYYYLSTEHGDVRTEFASGTIEISNMLRKSDGALVEAGNDARTLDGAATYTGGRTRIAVTDMAYTINPGASLEVKGIIKKA